MKFLLDTHVFLWFVVGDSRLPAKWRDAICQPNNDVFLSVVSLWESIIKHQLGRLPLPEPPENFLPAQRDRHQFASLPLDEASVRQLATLPPIHRDPFDRMLVCQAIEKDLVIVTIDEVFRSYPAQILDNA